MKHFAIYDQTTTLVIQKISGPYDSASQVFYDSISNDIIELTASEYSDVTLNNYRVVGGVLLDDVPNKPDYYYVWNPTTEVWEDGRTAGQARDANVAAANSTRAERLAITDWTQLTDAPDYIKDSYAPYRVALREIELQPGYPDTITWPTPPEFELYRVPDVGAIDEGSGITIILSTSDLVNGTLVPFTITGVNITTADIVSMTVNGDSVTTALTGNFNIQGGQSTLQITFANDVATEGVEEMIVYLPGTLPMVLVRVNINDTSYA